MKRLFSSTRSSHSLTRLAVDSGPLSLRMHRASICPNATVLWIAKILGRRRSYVRNGVAAHNSSNASEENFYTSVRSRLRSSAASKSSRNRFRAATSGGSMRSFLTTCVVKTSSNECCCASSRVGNRSRTRSMA